MKIFAKLTGIGSCLLAASIAVAQRTGDNNRAGGAPQSDLVSRMMAFDKDKDGKLTRAEVTDERLLRLFDRADADKDGNVTRDELTALATREAANDRQSPSRGGPGGPGMGPPPRPGEILPAMLQQRLGLSSEQKTQIEALQKEVDAKLAQILTDEQKTQLKQIRPRGPGGPGGFGGGPPGGRERPPGPDGPPPE